MENEQALEELLLDIVRCLRGRMEARDMRPLDALELDRIVRRHNRGVRDNGKHLSKRHILPFYLRIKEQDQAHWHAWGIDGPLEGVLLETLRMKPRRTASGVATITVLTRPQPCSGNCRFCPNDLRMPKSYLASEPACQRAAQNYFDPFLQVATRLDALHQMGHATDKVELIVLGGTWDDYPLAYRQWFVRELFRALNEWPVPGDELARRRERYRAAGISDTREWADELVAREQALVDAGLEGYNEGWAHVYGPGAAHVAASEGARPNFAALSGAMHADAAEVAAQHQANEHAAQRSVGLVFETRPDAITPQGLTHMRQLGATKVQIGVQSTSQEILDLNDRGATVEAAKRAFALARLFGFKIHAHLMTNLVGATPQSDAQDFKTFVTNPAFLPDELKLYPCALVGSSRLVQAWREGIWRPYTQDELVDLLVADVLETPPYLRISRMIRDIGADDILAGNKNANLRQAVDARIRELGVGERVSDVRFREVARSSVDLGTLALEELRYTTSVSDEVFLQWVTPDNHIAAFLRLSLPNWPGLLSGNLLVRASEIYQRPGEAMIREVHVYGQAAHLGRTDSHAQHRGLGRSLVRRACELARQAGYERLNVISAVGTREYYRHLGFGDAGLYQQRIL